MFMTSNPFDRLADAIAQRFPLLSQMLRDGSILVVTPSDAQTGNQVSLRTVIQFDGDVVITRRAGLRDSQADRAHMLATKAKVRALARELGRFRISGKVIDGARVTFVLGAPPAASLLGVVPAMTVSGLVAPDAIASAAWSAVVYLLPEATRAVLRPTLHWIVRRKLRDFGIPV